MKIVIDVGNSYIKVYYSKNECIVIPNTKDFYIKNNFKQLLELDNISNALICSVVPESNPYIISSLEENNIEYFNISSDIFSELINFGKLDYINMGADRVVTTYCAIEKFGENIIVFDIGTALTVDVVVDNVYKSGYIIPGVDLQKNILTNGASMIGDIHFQKVNKDYEAVDTNSQISDGILYAMMGSIHSLIKVSSVLFEKEYKIIITGGTINKLMSNIDVNLFNELIGYEYIIDKSLMRDGLMSISKKIWSDNETR